MSVRRTYTSHPGRADAAYRQKDIRLRSPRSSGWSKLRMMPRHWVAGRDFTLSMAVRSALSGWLMRPPAVGVHPAIPSSKSSIRRMSRSEQRCEKSCDVKSSSTRASIASGTAHRQSVAILNSCFIVISFVSFFFFFIYGFSLKVVCILGEKTIPRAVFLVKFASTYTSAAPSA